MGKSSALQSFFSHRPSDLDLTAVTKLPVPPTHGQASADKLPFNPEAINSLVQPYYSFVEMLNKKEGLITELACPDQFEDFLDEDALSYDGTKLSKVNRFPKYYRLVADTSGAADKCKQPRKQILVCKFLKCRATFSKVSSLIDHLLVHNADRPYICKTCGNSFAQLGNLRRHALTHSATLRKKNSNGAKSIRPTPNLTV
jgi:uncharacterized Zn-finger protein